MRVGHRAVRQLPLRKSEPAQAFRFQGLPHAGLALQCDQLLARTKGFILALRG